MICKSTVTVHDGLMFSLRDIIYIPVQRVISNRTEKLIYIIIVKTPLFQCQFHWGS